MKISISSMLVFLTTMLIMHLNFGSSNGLETQEKNAFFKSLNKRQYYRPPIDGYGAEFFLDELREAIRLEKEQNKKNRPKKNISDKIRIRFGNKDKN